MSHLRSDNSPPSAAETAWPRSAPLLVVGLLFALVWMAGAADLLSPQRLWAGHDALVEWVAGNRVAAMVGFFALYAGFAALSIPGGALLSVLAGFLFGAWTGGLIAVLAATSGAANTPRPESARLSCRPLSSVSATARGLTPRRRK